MKQHPKPLAKSRFKHLPVKAWDKLNKSADDKQFLIVQQEVPYLTAAVPEFGVHNTQIMTGNLLLQFHHYVEMFSREGISLLQELLHKSLNGDIPLQQPTFSRGRTNSSIKKPIHVCLKEWTEEKGSDAVTITRDFVQCCTDANYKIIIVFFKWYASSINMV